MSALLWALGFVGIAFGLLNFFVWIFDPARGGSDFTFVVLNLVGGFALLLAAALGNLDALRERLRSGEARRAGKYGTSAVLSTVLAVAIVAGLGFLSTRYHKRFDWSESGVHSLTSQSTKLLEGLDQDVQVVALFPPLDADPVRELLDRYRYASDRFVVEMADPNERPELLAKYEIDPEQLGQGVVRVALGGESVLVDEVTESNITNAIVKLTRTGEKKVYLLQGHNERPFEGEEGAAREGFSRAAEALRNENYQVEPLLLAARGDVPEDADVVVVAGATRPFLGAEREALTRYLARGGSLMVLLDPRANTDLVDDLRAWGVEVGEDVIVDRLRALFGQPTTPIAAAYDPEHEITREMREPALFHMARSIGANGEGGLTEIVFTGDSSWAERDLERFLGDGEAEFDEGADLMGPVAVAVAGRPKLPAEAETGPAEGAAAEEAGAEAAEAEEREPRLVVYGDADFATNELIEAYRNRDLFLNSVNWLMGDVEAISIRPAVSRATRLGFSSAEQFREIRTLSLFVLPQAIAIVGVFVWWSRRRAAAPRP